MKHGLLSITLFFFTAVLHAQSWKQLNDSLLYYYKNGNYTAALGIADRGVIQAKKEFGTENKIYATSLNNLAQLYMTMGNYTKAEPLYVEALNIRKKILGTENPVYAGSLNNLAALYAIMYNYTKAEPLYVEALNIFKKILGTEHPDYATNLSNLAELYRSMGNYTKAEPLYVEALNIRKKKLGTEHPDYATNLNNLAELYRSMGNYTKAEPLYVEALNIFKKILGNEHPTYAVSLNNLATLYANMGNYTKAEPLYIEALNIFKKILGTEHPDYATNLNTLAELYRSMGNYTKAEPLFVEALNIRKKILGTEHPVYAGNLNNLAELYRSMGNYTKAEPLFIAALNIDKKLLGEDHPHYATDLNNLAALYSSMGNYTKAEPLYIEALNIFKKILGTEHPAYVGSLNNLAGLYKGMGNYTRAEPFFIEGCARSFGHLLSNFTNLSEREKQTWLDKNGYINELILSLQYSYQSLSDTARQFILNQQLLLKSLILSDSKGILQTLQNSIDSSVQKLYSDWRGIKKQLSQQYSLPLDKRSNELSKWEQGAEDLEKQLNAKSSAFRQQQQSFRIKNTDVQKGLRQDEASIEFVRFQLYTKRWTDSTMYAAYILTKQDSIPVFVPLFEEKQLQQLFDSAGTSSDALVSKFYRGVELGNTGTAASLGKDLYNLVWAPLEPYLKGKKKISYSPAGKLYSIAFHALPVDSNKILMDKYELNQYTSTRQVALRKTQEENRKPQSISLFGDARFTMDSTTIAQSKTNNTVSNIYTPPNRGNRGNSWTDLPGTAEEVKKIKQLFEQNKISTKSFTQAAASEENLKALSGNSPQILHIATHGFFLPEPDKKRKDNFSSNDNSYTLADDPLLRSGLILSGGNYAWSGKTPIEGVEDGIATAYEISQLNLSNTELVVLSACETALGDVKGSEGVFGLQRAFKMSGVKKMIVSLWQVPDKETAELMTAFYGYWLKGKTIEQAFTQAQAEMRKKYSPYYWAAFVLVE